MIRVAHVSGSRAGEAFSSPGPLIRVGRSAGCDLRYDAEREPRVSYHHAELVLDGGRWFVVDTESEHGVLVNGKRVQRQLLRLGDRIVFGQGGPEVRVEAADGSAASEDPQDGLSAMRQEAYRVITATRGVADEEDEAPPARAKEAAAEEEEEEEEAREEPEESGEAEEDEEEEEEERRARPTPAPRAKARGANGVAASARNGKDRGGEKSAAKRAEEVAELVARHRALTGGQSSGQTSFIVAGAIEEANQEARRRARRQWIRIVSAVAAGAVLITSGMGVVILQQRRKIESLASEKKSLDDQIAAVEQQMLVEKDEAKLAELDQLLQELTGQAKGKRDKLSELGRQDQGDELDREIRAVLKKFNAETYAVPAVFKERLRWHIDWLVTRKNWKESQERWVKYWPMIRQTFRAQDIPEELGYIAYVESQFGAEGANDNHAGARGMWQFIPATATKYKLRVDGGKDERTDPARATVAAAEYLDDLLSEFGGKSDFMLALASYNKGEDGVRKVLRKVGHKNRDFWHLYRMKLLPPETSEYVPAVIAAAIVFGNPLHYGGPTLPDPEGQPK